MRLDKPFYKLPVLFDVERLRAEVESLPQELWVPHPNDIAGNDSLRLISVAGGENDEVNGNMLPTPLLLSCAYIQQVLASFGVVWSRSRLLRLSARHGVPQHADINYHWFYRTRLHVPIVTHPDVRFHCGDESVHMAAGEAWIFDNWRLHRVDNPVDAARIHLVADTAGTASFWDLVAAGEAPEPVVHRHRFDPTRASTLLTERVALHPVMPPGEIDLLAGDLQHELTSAEDTPAQMARLAEFHRMLAALRRDWRQLYLLFGDSEAGWDEFRKLRDSVRAIAPALGQGLFMRTNRVAAQTVLEARILRVALSPPAADAPRVQALPRRARVLDRPIFIVAAPRSGSTLLFETLAASSQLCTVGGEAHWLVESIEALQLGAPGVDSNRLTQAQASPAVKERMLEMIAERLIDNAGRRAGLDSPLVFLEKTPKNSLRIPFFDALFADARFIFLWREPRGNLSSIMEAWRSGRWKTYNGLPGFDGPWSLLLPPGWAEMNQRPLEEIAAFQWQAANRIILDDLQTLPPQRWTSVCYQDLVERPEAALRSLCESLNLDYDADLAHRVSRPLPLAASTHTPPQAAKWTVNESAINRVLPSVQSLWDRLRSLA